MTSLLKKKKKRGAISSENRQLGAAITVGHLGRVLEQWGTQVPIERLGVQLIFSLHPPLPRERGTGCPAAVPFFRVVTSTGGWNPVQPQLSSEACQTLSWT